ncbi:MAG: sirohydrochlorin ferrochelatase [Candidatus Omnitrophota bacterium]|jgi:sirohydrochlorin ferrochelatase
MKKGILLISHGSRSDTAYEEVMGLGNELQKLWPDIIMQTAFLEINSPSIPEGIGHLSEKGVTDLQVLLNFLNSGRHVLEHIPQIVEEACESKNIKYQISKHIGAHPDLPKLFFDVAGLENK